MALSQKAGASAHVPHADSRAKTPQCRAEVCRQSGTILVDGHATLTKWHRTHRNLVALALVLETKLLPRLPIIRHGHFEPNGVLRVLIVLHFGGGPGGHCMYVTAQETNKRQKKTAAQERRTTETRQSTAVESKQLRFSVVVLSAKNVFRHHFLGQRPDPS